MRTKTIGQVRDKIVEHFIRRRKKPTSIIELSLELMTFLDEADHAALERFEKRVGEDAAFDWYVQLSGELRVNRATMRLKAA